MLNDREVRLLLAHAISYDARISDGQSNVAAWTEASKRGRWTYDEALEAVHEHYAVSSNWLMPGIVTQAIKATRQDAAMRAPQDPPPDPIGQVRLAELTTGAFQAITDGPPDPGETTRRAAMARPCSHCQSRPGEPCTRPSHGGRVSLAKVHPSRLDGAA